MSHSQTIKEPLQYICKDHQVVWQASPKLLMSKVVTIGKELQMVSHCLLCSSSLMLRRRSLISLPATRYQDGCMPNGLLVTSHNHHLICLNKTRSKDEIHTQCSHPTLPPLYVVPRPQPAIVQFVITSQHWLL